MSNVLVDTCVWSTALRSKSKGDRTTANILSQLIDEHRVKLIGPIRQELLSGCSNKSKYEVLRQKLSYFPNHSILDKDYEAAAEYSNVCRTKGIQGSHIDFLICAVANRDQMQIYTSDNDFTRYAKHLPIYLFT